MKTTELIQRLKTTRMTETEFYNNIIDDLFDVVPQETVATPEGQKMVEYFMYKIRSILYPVVCDLLPQKQDETPHSEVETAQRLAELRRIP